MTSGIGESLVLTAQRHAERRQAGLFGEGAHAGRREAPIVLTDELYGREMGNYGCGIIS